MSRNHSRRPLILFSLKPLSEAAEQVVANPANGHLISRLPNGRKVLDIGFNIKSKSSLSLATIGSGDADILVSRSDIAPIQCSFEINWNSGAVMLRDTSMDLSTHVFGADAIPFRHDRPRRVVVIYGINSKFGMGHGEYGTVQFRLLWRYFAQESITKIIARRPDDGRREESPQISFMRSPFGFHNGSARAIKIRHVKIKTLGSGYFGTVSKAIDVDTGKLMAVKQAKMGAAKTVQDIKKQQLELLSLQREIQALERTSHPNIIDYIGTQDGQLFMGLKEGDLESLVKETDIMPVIIARSVLSQVLRGLDYLDCQGIIHRDLKPSNILYNTRPNGRAIFVIADFGCSNTAHAARSGAGTFMYMAPEMSDRGRQTSKMDVWSLFVTMMWILNVNGFQELERQLNSAQEAQELVVQSCDQLIGIQEMAAVDPLERASAAQMLVKLFKGKGLSTPRHRVSPIYSNIGFGDWRRIWYG